MKINTNVRNVLIIAVIAAAFVWVPWGGSAEGFILALVSLAFLGALAWIAGRLYREHRAEVYALGDRRRLLLYASVGAIVVTLTASPRLTTTGFGTVVMLVVLGAAAYTVFAVIRSARSY